MRGLAPQEITQKGWKNPRTVNWDADGRGLFVFADMTSGAALVHVDLHGNAQVLWKVLGATSTTGRPSPDGRNLAFLDSTWEGDMWMMENF